MGPDRGVLIVADAGLLADVTAEVLVEAGQLVTRAGRDAGAWAAREQALAVVIVDALTDALAVLDELVSVGVPVLAITAQAGPAAARELILGGATSVFTTAGSARMLLAAVDLTAGGTSVLAHPAAGLIIDEWRRLAAAERSGATGTAADLTNRELEVLEALAGGLAAKAVARRLGVSLKTVESHKANLFKKLGVRTQAQAVALALRSGLVQGEGSPATADMHRP